MTLLNNQSEANQAAIAAEARADAAEAALARGAARGAGPAANDDALIDPVVVAEAMERHLAFLREMGELGMAMARMATRRALAEAPDAVADPGDAPGTGAADADMAGLAPDADWAPDAGWAPDAALAPDRADAVQRIVGRAADRQDWG